MNKFKVGDRIRAYVIRKGYPPTLTGKITEINGSAIQFMTDKSVLIDGCSASNFVAHEKQCRKLRKASSSFRNVYGDGTVESLRFGWDSFQTSLEAARPDGVKELPQFQGTLEIRNGKVVKFHKAG